MKRAVVMTLLGGLLLLGVPSTAFADDDGGKGRGERRGDHRRHDGDGDDRHRRHDGDGGDRHRRHDGDGGDRHRRHDGDGDDRHRRHDGDGDDDGHRRHYRYYYGDYYDDCSYYRGGRYRDCRYGRCGYYRGYDRDRYYGDCGYSYGGGRYYRSSSTSYVADLTADQEVPDPGPSVARGTARINLNDARDQVCYTLTYERIPRPTAGHIHRGAAGTSGPVAVNLDPAANGNQACMAGDPSVLQEIQSNPGGFYVNLHTAEHPDGAIRGQLATGGSY
jgi:hypothetical protein